MTEQSKKKPNIKIGFRTAGRMLAIQGLYILEITGRKVMDVMDNLEMMVDDSFIEYVEKDHCDFAHTQDVLKGVTTNQINIDGMISKLLPEKWTFKRLDRVLCALLRSAVFELLYKKDIPAKIVINEYMNMASAFGLQDSNKMVGGILNKITHGDTPIDKSSVLDTE